MVILLAPSSAMQPSFVNALPGNLHRVHTEALTFLGISNWDITILMLAVLSSMTSLMYLDLSSCKETPVLPEPMRAQLSRLQRLRSVRMLGSSLPEGEAWLCHL